MPMSFDAGAGETADAVFGVPFPGVGPGKWEVLVRVPDWHSNYEITVTATTAEGALAEAQEWLHVEGPFLGAIHRDATMTLRRATPYRFKE
jgi:hypothetical protein